MVVVEVGMVLVLVVVVAIGIVKAAVVKQLSTVKLLIQKVVQVIGAAVS